MDEYLLFLETSVESPINSWQPCIFLASIMDYLRASAEHFALLICPAGATDFLFQISWFLKMLAGMLVCLDP